MKLIEIKAFDNGAHRNQECYDFEIPVPEGWAVINEDIVCDNFPFGGVEVEEVNGVMTVTKWNALPIPEPEPEPELEPTTEEILLEMAADHEERLCMMELGI